MKLDPNGTSLTLNIARTLTATEVEDLIQQLADCRLQMTPEVPGTVAKASAEGCRVLDLGAPAIKWSWDGAALQMLVASRSTGWLAIRIEERDAQGLADFLGIATAEKVGDRDSATYVPGGPSRNN